ncbi:sigma-70 family RNA polymerase sigma factor [Streptosporangium sp. NPDC000563]|uniref:RNA polymerase sigma factor n=1 Tax=unclassified Streptosporangium TaxID=2632669 RepID=UPI003326C2BD
MDDPEARFTALYDQHYRSVLGYTLLRAERQAAEDIASETFLIAWRQLEELPEPPLPWLLGVARNLLRGQRRSGLRRRALVERLAELSSEGDVTERVAEQVAEREAALAALAGLSELDAEAVILASWYGLAPADAAKLAGCSARAFTVRLYRARRRLSQALDLTPTTTLQEQS